MAAVGEKAKLAEGERVDPTEGERKKLKEEERGGAPIIVGKTTLLLPFLDRMETMVEPWRRADDECET